MERKPRKIQKKNLVGCTGEYDGAKKKWLNLDIAVVSNNVTGPNKHANVI